MLRHLKLIRDSTFDLSQKMRDFAGFIGTFGSDSNFLGTALGTTAAALKEFEDERTKMMEEIACCLKIRTQEFIDTHMRAAKKASKEFSRTSEQTDTMSLKFSKMKKADTAHEMELELNSSKRMQKEAILELACAINIAKRHLQLTLAEGMRGLLQALCRQFSCGADFFTQRQQFVATLEEHVTACELDTTKKDSDELALKRSLVSKRDMLLQPALSSPGSSQTETEGYLFKKATCVGKPWKRRYFKVADGQFFYYRDGKNISQADTAVDLLMTTLHVRDDLERRFCFEILTPPTNTFLLQAESATKRAHWISTINNARAALLAKNGDADEESDHPEFKLLQKLHKSNTVCADCGSPGPDWVSMNLGVLLCLGCSAVHRKVSVPTTKVRSMTLDHLEPELLLMFASLGNAAANTVWQCRMTPADAPPAGSDHATRTQFVVAKYERRAFIAAPELHEDHNVGAYKAVKHGNVKQLLYHLAHHADLTQTFGEERRSLLHVAVAAHAFACLGMLLVWNCPINAVDARQRTALHYAVERDRHADAVALLKAGADAGALDADGQTPLDLAWAQRADGGRCFAVFCDLLTAPGDEESSDVDVDVDIRVRQLDEEKVRQACVFDQQTLLAAMKDAARRDQRRQKRRHHRDGVAEQEEEQQQFSHAKRRSVTVLPPSSPLPPLPPGARPTSPLPCSRPSSLSPSPAPALAVTSPLRSPSYASLPRHVPPARPVPTAPRRNHRSASAGSRTASAATAAAAAAAAATTGGLCVPPEGYHHACASASPREDGVVEVHRHHRRHRHRRDSTDTAAGVCSSSAV
eukprot:TRINITY_DN1662_c4_g1_i1.p1 TRINITY_DN1662_c4_g1~~TRINITY_DN1662_c4_g1_i1.p1  ORF type:complete len:877 (+),score=223.18 TRINITY_DN1662_c4_g1_i1:199-2631(+)